MTTTYAGDTSVSVERSRAEIEGTLAKYGASRFGYMTDETYAVIGFVMNGKAIKFALPRPNPAADEFTKYTYMRANVRREGGVNPPETARKLWEQACRARWRSLNLCIKAKCECVASGITTFEEEFLAHIVTPGGRTIGQRLLPQLAAIVADGKMPSLQLTE